MSGESVPTWTCVWAGCRQPATESSGVCAFVDDHAHHVHCAGCGEPIAASSTAVVAPGPACPPEAD